MTPDKKKVIKKLESLRDICNAKSNMAIGKGKVAWAGYANTADDALALLKEQEPMMVRLTASTIRCPKCGKQITSRGAIHREIKFCWKCGQAVKWE